jgi:hypothetical protein
MTDFCIPKIQRASSVVSPGKIFEFVRLVFVFGIRNFLPSRGIIISVNRFSAKILGLWACFLYQIK